MFNIPIVIHSHFDFELKNTITGEIKTYRSYNITLNNFLLHMINRDYTGSSVIIYLGQGTGTLSPSRTSLFNLRGSVSASLLTTESDFNSTPKKAVYEVVLGTTYFNGNITEIGLGTSYYLLTHSLITDSEGNPITIVKTSLDVLTIRATLYGRVFFKDSDFINLYAKPVDGEKISENTDMSWNTLERNSIVINFDHINMHLSALKNPPYASLNLAQLYHTSLNYTTDTTNYILRLYQNVTDTQGNRDEIYIVKSIIFTGLGYIPFPNHNYFPRKLLEYDNVFIGDGTTTEFNLPVPELGTEMGVNVDKFNNAGVFQGTVTTGVYIDNIIVPTTDYEWSGRNYNMAQAWESGDFEHLTVSGNVRVANYPNFFFPFTSSSPSLTLSPESPLIWDFLTPKIVNAFRGLVYANNNSLFLDYSDDGNTWTQIAEIVSSYNNSQIVITFADISARYWRVRVLNNQNNGESIYGMFGHMRPMLKFNTPPASGANISIKTYTDYPIKNSNFQLNISGLDLTFGRTISFVGATLSLILENITPISKSLLDTIDNVPLVVNTTIVQDTNGTIGLYIGDADSLTANIKTLEVLST
jgi:hypothetical protein